MQQLKNLAELPSAIPPRRGFQSAFSWRITLFRLHGDVSNAMPLILLMEQPALTHLLPAGDRHKLL